MFDFTTIGYQSGGNNFIFQVQLNFTILGHVLQEGSDVLGEQLGSVDRNTGRMIDVTDEVTPSTYTFWFFSVPSTLPPRSAAS
jgi:hypothetical protein